MKQWLKHKEGE